MTSSEQSLSLSTVLATTDATLALGRALGCHLKAGSVLLLEGDLGSGKTTFIQGVGTGLGIAEPIVSPTFTLVQEYLDGRLPLYHLDLYRLKPGEVGGLHPEIYWQGQEVEPGIVAIEWAERLPIRPSDYLWICFHCEEKDPSLSSRRIVLQSVGCFNLPNGFSEMFSQLRSDA